MIYPNHPRHPSPDVHWYLYSDREVRERQRFTLIIAAPSMALFGLMLLTASIIFLLIKPFTVDFVLGALVGLSLLMFSLFQSSEVLIRTGDLRSDDKGVYLQKVRTDEQILIPYEVMDFAKRKHGRKYSGVRLLPVESFTIIPVRGVRNLMLSLVGFEYGFGFRPVIIISKFHEDSDALLARIEAETA